MCRFHRVAIGIGNLMAKTSSFDSQLVETEESIKVNVEISGGMNEVLHGIRIHYTVNWHF